MNKIIALFGCITFFLVFGGCSQKSGKISIQTQSESKDGENLSNDDSNSEIPDTEVFPDFFPDANQTAEFPESMVGVWEVVVNEFSGAKWGIKFERDGSIKRIIHQVTGEVNVEAGGVDDEGTEGTCWIFAMGPCEARYIPRTRTIKVKIIVDHYLIKIPSGELTGKIEDYFEGPVSEDGRTWTVTWMNFGWLEGASPPPIDYLKEHPATLVFTKVDVPQDKQKDAAQ